MVTYKGTIQTSYDGEYFYFGKHLSIEDAKKEILDYCGDEYLVTDVEHVYYRTGWLPEEVREDGENTYGWWIVDDAKIRAGKATGITVKRNVK